MHLSDASPTGQPDRASTSTALVKAARRAIVRAYFRSRVATTDVEEDGYAANVASGRGVDLAVIFGLESTQDKKTIVLFERGKETMILPGSKPCNNCLGEGAKIMKM